MNIFYATPEQIHGNTIELTGQEAVHASRALRYSRGDAITIVDGRGGWYEGSIHTISQESVQISVTHSEQRDPAKPELVLAMGIIKKKDRLEFAVEKATELGVQQIALFRGEHTVKQNVRADRLQTIMVSAMKQSLQSRLPTLTVCDSLKNVTDIYPGAHFMLGQQNGEKISEADISSSGDKIIVVLIGPEGGFSDREMEIIEATDHFTVSLSSNRLRTETAAVSFLSFIRAQ